MDPEAPEPARAARSHRRRQRRSTGCRSSGTPAAAVPEGWVLIPSAEIGGEELFEHLKVAATLHLFLYSDERQQFRLRLI